MRVGLHALGIGTGAHPEVIRAVALAAEAAGFATLWSGEHVVLVDQPSHATRTRLTAGAGVTEFVVVATPPAHPAAAATWVEELAAYPVVTGLSSGSHRGQVLGLRQLWPHRVGNIRPNRPGDLGVPSTLAFGAVPLLGCGGLIQLADRHDGGLSGINTHLGEDGHEHLAEGLEAFCAVPDVVHHGVAILTETGVVQAVGIWFRTGLFQTLMDLGELRECHVPGVEIRGDGHGWSPVVGGCGRFCYDTGTRLGSPI